jgi:hypothetical protein
LAESRRFVEFAEVAPREAIGLTIAPDVPIWLDREGNIASP